MRVGEPIRHYRIAPQYGTPRPSWWGVAGWAASIIAVVVAVAWSA